MRGPFITDPSCYYDPATRRWFHVVLTLDTVPATGAFTGGNHLDIAVSRSSDPTGAWTIYHLAAEDDGTSGTPDHGCSLGPCLGDYPHIGADANGFYITPNEYSFFGPEFHGAQIYALSKHDLAAGAASVAVTQFDTAGMVGGNPGFTVWPATSSDIGGFGGRAGTSNGGGQGGAEYFMSSDAAAEANGTGTSSDLIVWTLAHTSSLARAVPSLALSNRVLSVSPYAIPPLSDQKAGDFPQGQCLNDPACSPNLIGGPDPFAPEVISQPDSNDSRMQQVVYANGRLWGALDTALTIHGQDKAGIAYFVVNPAAGKVDRQGYLGLAGNDLTYPAIAVSRSGRAVMAFTLMGADHYPSAAYAALDAKAGAGPVHVAAEGLGPDDGFTGYKAQVGDPPRTRWGDYGAAVVVGDSIWIASEYIGQTCSLSQYEAAPFGSCGGTRTSLANWATRISRLDVHP